MAGQPPVSRTRTHDDYQIGNICALAIEDVALLHVLDERHGRLQQLPGDVRRYKLGSMSGHDVVIACSPAGSYGTKQASYIASDMQRSFRRLRFVLMVGIGGGVPNQARGMRLENVAVSIPSGRYPGLVEYDMGKVEQQGFILIGSLDRPPTELLHAVQELRESHLTGDNQLDAHINAALQRLRAPESARFRFPGHNQDRLY
ncbi:Hypothetical protein D9617_2g053940 [Elsinoe fawcettii]|nr:Hypothetical protein D9617_2g053940 [Elsinoe fawcettii]